ncbi:hypothetical protein SB781_40975, partial [Paraburkholderia sp. SIMBA_061]
LDADDTTLERARDAINANARGVELTFAGQVVGRLANASVHHGRVAADLHLAGSGGPHARVLDLAANSAATAGIALN